MTVDSEDDYIYWTDVSNQKIERANLDGRNRRTIIWSLDKPRAIILYKSRRFVNHSIFYLSFELKRSMKTPNKHRLVFAKLLVHLYTRVSQSFGCPARGLYNPDSHQ